MPPLLSKKLLSEAKVASRPMPDGIASSILRGLLLATDEGVLVTDLDHRSLAANQKFGELFRITPEQVVSMDPEALRRKVYPRLQDPDAWKRQLDEIYALPDRIHEDEMELIGEPPVFLLRTTGPIQDADGKTIARLWRFRDISAHKQRERMRDILMEISTCRDADPARVCRLVVEKLSAFYKSSAILSIRADDKMVFREVAGMPIPFSFAKSNKIKNSYCQVALKTVQPKLIQNGRIDPDMCRLPAPRLGFTRYLGVPICDRTGCAIGTLCIMDGHSDIPLGPDDEQFMSMLGLRVATELDRERIYLERTSEQRGQLEKQQLDLSETHQVVTAMNDAFEMASETMTTGQLIEAQAKLLGGLLGYESAFVLFPESATKLSGTVATKDGKTKRISFPLADVCIQKLFAVPVTNRTVVHFIESDGQPLCEVLEAKHIALASLPISNTEKGVVAFGTSKPAPQDDKRHRLLLEAVADQVSLLLTAHTLQQDLLSTHVELKTTQQKLVQSEKLSVVGTLSASIAHDIRNIVSSLSLECSLGDVDPTSALANVRTQLDRFAVLAHRLLSYAKPKLVAQEPAEINDLLRRVIALTDAQTRVSGVTFSNNLSDQKLYALLDVSQTEHLFVNLVLNSVQAMRCAGGWICVSVIATEDTAKIHVEDNGPGIKPEELSRIFEPFHSTKPEGFGLGLYSCKRIADEHGWKLSVESIEGQGTSFEVCIPICEGHD